MVSMENMWIIFGLWVLSMAATVQADLNTIKLYKQLMDPEHYESAVRPTPSHLLPTNVTFGFLLHQVINVDEKNQQLTTSSWMNVNWMDQRLQWNQSEWGGVKILHIPNQKVWKPDLILTNNADNEYKESIVSTDVFVTPEGNVTWLYFAIYTSSCQIRVRFYPFDDQECVLTFASWSYDMANVDLRLLTEEGDLSNYVNNSEWAMLGMTAHRKVLKFSVGNVPWPVVTITIKLGRRPLFYVFNHIIPCVLILIMSMLGFYIPAETGEKVTMCITTLLSMGVFLKTITESMPPSAEAIPLIGMYYVVSLFIVCAATFVNVVTLNVHNRGSKNSPTPIPKWAREVILGRMARWVCISVYPSDVHMVHLAERRRQMGNDDELLTEIAISHNYSKKFGTPIIIKSETEVECPTMTPQPPNPSAPPEESPMATTDKPPLSVFADKPPTSLSVFTDKPPLSNFADKPPLSVFPTDKPPTSLSVPNGRQRLPRRSASHVFYDHHRPAGSMCRTVSQQENKPAQEKPDFRTRSIYDYDYELQSLRKLNSQAHLMSGALTLMQAPLDPGEDPEEANHYDNLGRFDTLIGKERLASFRGPKSTTSASLRLDDRPSSRLSVKNNVQQKRSIGSKSRTIGTKSKPPPAQDRYTETLKMELEDNFCRVLRKVYQTLEQNDLRTSLNDERTQIMWEWKQLATVVDRALMLLFVLATGLTTFLILFERAIFDDQVGPVDDTIPSVI